MIAILQLPQTWMLLVILAVSSLVFRVKPSAAALTAVVLYVVSFLLANMWQLAPNRDLAVKLYQLGAFIMLALLVAAMTYMVFKPKVLQEGDLLAKLTWVILLIAEIGQVVEYFECKILLDPYSTEELRALWGVEVSKYACGRAWGPMGPFVFPLITTAFLAWILFAAYRGRRTTLNVGFTEWGQLVQDRLRHYYHSGISRLRRDSSRRPPRRD